MWGGGSDVQNFVFDPDFLRISTRLAGSYSGSFPPLPGGMMSGEMTSIIEFAMPVESLVWDLGFIVDETPSFDLSALLTIENVTSGETLVSVSETFGFLSTLEGNVGDVIRISTEYEVAGGVGAGISGFFSSRVIMISRFWIPEPTTASLLLAGAGLFFMARKRSGR
jgi:PEP-CTERM motif